MRNKPVALTLLTALVAVAPFTVRAVAQTPPTPPTATVSSDVLAARAGAISYGGETLFRIRTGAGGYTAAQRAEAVKERMVPILSLENLTPSDITIQQTRPFQDASIYVRDRLLVTVDRGMALANGDKDPADLARIWADRARRILPRASVSQDESPFRSPNDK